MFLFIFIFQLYLFNISLSFAGFSDLRLFKSIDEKRISIVEKFVRERLLGLLEARCHKQNIPLSPEDKSYFFGEYVSNLEAFEFSDDEKKLILSLVKYAKQMFESTDISSAIAQMSINDPKDRFQCPNWYFEDHQNLIATAKTDLYDSPINEIFEKEAPDQTHTHRILQKLLATTNQNSTRPKAGYRFDPEVKRWAACLRILSGPIAYNILQKNLELALPSLSRINYFVQNTHETTIEGVLRSEELLIYLKERNLDLVVSLSEDATFVVDRVQFNSKKNQLIGFVLPINQNGMPVPFVYSAKDTDDIVRHFAVKTPVAKFVITVMAQPIGNAPPFPLLVFGTDSKFVAEDVSARWNFITNKLNELGITVLTISSDSDPKYNSAMRKNSRLGRKSDVFFGAEWFKCGRSVNFPFYVQDTVHLGTKLRNLLFKTFRDPSMLKFGDSYILMAHLQYIVNNIPKDQHEITQSVLDPTDRQNFKSVQRICDSRVLTLLKKYIKGSAGTIKYLEITKNFLDAYIDISLAPLERVSKCWYSIFLVRIWRLYVLDQPLLTLKHNFLTSYTYSCMEQNAHSMVLILMHLRERNLPNLFTPWLYSSQPCKSFFRKIRALSPCNSTVTNFTVKEMIDRIHKIQLKSEISCDPATTFIFHTLKSNQYTPSIFFDLPTEEEILNKIKQCRIQAINDAIELKLISKDQMNINLDCNLSRYLSKRKSINVNYETFLQTDEENEIEAHNEILQQLKNVYLKNFADQFADDEPVNEASPYAEVFGGKRRIVLKKQSIVWLLRKTEKKLSSDRLQRVKTDRSVPLKKKKLKNCVKKVKIYSKKRIRSKRINKTMREKI